MGVNDFWQTWFFPKKKGILENITIFSQEKPMFLKAQKKRKPWNLNLKQWCFPINSCNWLNIFKHIQGHFFQKQFHFPALCKILSGS